MKKIKYTIKDELGIHARPAGLLVKLMTKFTSDITIGTPAKMVDAKRIMGVMGLGIKKGTEVTLTFNGDDEVKAASEAEAFLKSTL